MNTAFTDECGKRYAECATTFGAPGGNDAGFELRSIHWAGDEVSPPSGGYLKCGLSGTNLMTLDKEERVREDRGAPAISADLNLKWGWSPGARPAVTEHFDVRHGSGPKSHLQWAASLSIGSYTIKHVDVLEIGELGADVARVRKEPEIRQIEDDQMSPHITGGRVHAQKCAREGQGARERFAQVPCRTIVLVLFHPFPAGAVEQAAPAIPRSPMGTRPLSVQLKPQ
ncbi:hypothetical protein FA13DRAFT_1715057 [Coprinellus micaceus]|uniref:Uncharacterized protein n=1 Tax=Coprinellus micaceus TaxID=71717 RepID=A0A4Y7SPK8_COPMI|nr:hypothetical protein FA13DRAFT_1715057 [Coprinellus micaceus]